MHPFDVKLSSGNRKTENICICKERERERDSARKKFRAHTHVVPERRTASWPSKHTACLLAHSFLYPFYRYCCCNCLCIQFATPPFHSLSLSPSLSRIQWNHITKKRVNETKITIHHRTKKKNKGFLTNNNDRHVTNMNSSFLSSFCSYLHSIIFAF